MSTNTSDDGVTIAVVNAFTELLSMYKNNDTQVNVSGVMAIMGLETMQKIKGYEFTIGFIEGALIDFKRLQAQDENLTKH